MGNAVHTEGPSAVTALLASNAAFLVALALFAGSLAAAQCEFRFGFRILHDLIPGVVGECLANEQYNPENGDSLQATTKGLLVWRKADNFTAFTDGYRTWINGPHGLQVRLNTERFSWEADYPLWRIGVLAEFFSTLPDACAAAFLDLTTRQRVSVRGDRPQYAASLYKPMLVLGAGNALAEGKLSLTSVLPNGETLQSSLYQAIALGSNAHGRLVGDVLDWAALTMLARSFGMVNTDLNTPGVLTSAHDIVLLLSKIADGTLFDQRISADLAAILFAEPQERFLLGSLLPPGWDVATKYGYFPRYFIDETGRVTLNDVIYRRDGYPYVGAVLCTGYASDDFRSVIESFAQVLMAVEQS